MNSRDRQIYRGLLILSGVLPIVGVVFAIFSLWIFAAIFAALWMMGMVALVHFQTRVINAGARALRDSLAGRASLEVSGSGVGTQLDTLAKNVALLQKNFSTEISRDDVNLELVNLAQTLRRQMRMLQYAISTKSDRIQTDGEYSADRQD